jgi:signal transduction histidine kinase/streptogramin lyase
LYVDHDNTLWVATGMPWQEDTLGGLNRYIPENESFERYIHDPDNPVSITNNKVRAMFEDSKGNFWVGTAGDGLHKLDRKTGSFTHYPYDPSDPNKISKPFLYGNDPTGNSQFSHITSFFEDNDGRLWITATYAGLNVYDPETGTAFHFERGPGEDEMKTNFIWQTFQSDDGTIWIATGGDGQEVYKLREENLLFPFYDTQLMIGDSAKKSHGIFKDDEGKIWLGLSGNNPNDPERSKLWQIDPSTWAFERIFFGGGMEDSMGYDGFLGGITQDHEENIWIGTEHGYFIGNTKEDKFLSFRPDFVTSEVFGFFTAISANDGKIWIVNWDSGVFRYDPDTEEYEIFEHNPTDPKSLSGPVATSIFEDSKGAIWIGGGTPWYDPNQLLFLDRFDPITNTFQHFINEPITNGTVSDITEDQNGNIWFIDLYDGLYKLNPVTEELKKFTPYNSLLPKESFQYLFTHPNGNIWIGGDNSVIELDPAWETFSVYNELHGIEPAWNFWNAGWMGKDGELLMARTGGFHAFNPETFLGDIKDNLPDLRITGFRLLDDHITSGITISQSVLDEPIWRTSEIELESYENVFSFSVACFDFYEPEVNQIQFMLEGYDRSWRQDIRDGETPYYVNVNPGEYVFRLRGANSLGVWNKEGISLKITIYPPWYMTWWAYISYFLILSGGVFAVDRFQRRRLVTKEREKAQQRELTQAREIEKAYNELKNTQKQLIHSEKMASLGELTAGIAHEIQNPLNFVNNFSEVNRELIEELKDAFASNDQEEIHALLKDLAENEEKVKHHGMRAEGIVKSMLQHSRSGSGKKESTDINTLCDEYLRLAFHGFRAKDKSFNADFKLNLDPDLPKVNVVQQDIGRVLLNLVNNAFQAVNSQASSLEKADLPKAESGYKPQVSISTRRLDGEIEIKISDNGPGIPDEVKNKIFQPFFTTKPSGQGTGLGLSLSYDIVKAHGGEIIVETKENEGTEFTINLKEIK